MNLVEFNAFWIGNYSTEEEKSYAILYGDNKETWPHTEDISPIVIDVDRICRFNPHHAPDKTTVELAGGFSFCICIPYEEFKTIMYLYGQQIHSTINK